MPIFIVINLIIFEVLLVFVHLAVYGTMAAAFGLGGTIIKALFILLAFTFVAASVASHYLKARIIDWWYTFSAYWFGLVHFLFGGAVLTYFTLTIFYHYNTYVSPALVGGIWFGAFFLLHLYGTWNSWRARITIITMPLRAVPDAWKGKRFVFLSDIHLGNVRQEGFSKKIVKRITAIAPEAVFIGGDLFDGPKCDEDRVIAPFKTLRPPRGFYYISGNHEYYLHDVARAFEAIRNAGMTILNNEIITVNEVDFAGVDYKTTNQKDDFIKVLKGMRIDRHRPTILLKHEPKDLDIAEQASFAAGLFGHTHQGQIWPLSLLTQQLYKGFDYGLKPHGTMQVYTSSGVGTWGPPLRLATRSEIVVVEFAERT